MYYRVVVTRYINITNIAEVDMIFHTGDVQFHGPSARGRALPKWSPLYPHKFLRSTVCMIPRGPRVGGRSPKP